MILFQLFFFFDNLKNKLNESKVVKCWGKKLNKLTITYFTNSVTCFESISIENALFGLDSFSILTIGSLLTSDFCSFLPLPFALVDVASHFIVSVVTIGVVVESATMFFGDVAVSVFGSSLISSPNCLRRFSANDVATSSWDSRAWISRSKKIIGFS